MPRSSKRSGTASGQNRSSNFSPSIRTGLPKPLWKMSVILPTRACSRMRHDPRAIPQPVHRVAAQVLGREPAGIGRADDGAHRGADDAGRLDAEVVQSLQHDDDAPARARLRRQARARWRDARRGAFSSDAARAQSSGFRGEGEAGSAYRLRRRRRRRVPAQGRRDPAHRPQKAEPMLKADTPDAVTTSVSTAGKRVFSSAMAPPSAPTSGPNRASPAMAANEIARQRRE